MRLEEVKEKEMHWIYIVECSDGTYYTGYTRNVEKRIKEHNESKKGAQ